MVPLTTDVAAAIVAAGFLGLVVGFEFGFLCRGWVNEFLTWMRRPRNMNGAVVRTVEHQLLHSHCTCVLYPAIVRKDCPRHLGKPMDPPDLKDPDHGF